MSIARFFFIIWQWVTFRGHRVYCRCTYIVCSWHPGVFNCPLLIWNVH